ncbi:YigZ family protein [Pseudomonas sp. RIT-PI-AD]|uniref:IMPACT family protein n=1 Tax=Pseudomonas sp. RIT-PI-AD TaxID=3035294 RepID=UPI0021DA23AA|nr:YigZ family protein [Pseudomonas sp. RIT-PI-AD]
MPFTLAAPCEYREEIRKSRFLALAAPLNAEAEAQAFIAARRDATASHNCWAWRFGEQYRFSDDGEPGGTAGRPILAALDGQGCDRVVLLVIRWYGGIPLGTGGLARAYGGSAAKCLQGGERLALLPRVRAGCRCGFSEWPLLQSRLVEFAALVEGETYGAEGVDLVLAVPEAQLIPLDRWLGDISRGRSRLRLL